MAKVRAPLHSMDLRGRFADGAVFTDWKGISCLRTFVMPSQPQTKRRDEIRANFPKVTRAWAGLTDEERARWEEYAITNKPQNKPLGREGNWSGFDAYVSVNLVLGDIGTPFVTQPPAQPFPNPPEKFRLQNTAPGTVQILWKPLPSGTFVDLWLNLTKPSRKAYPSKFKHLVYVDGSTGVYALAGIPAGSRVSVKGRIVRTDGGKAGYAQTDIVI